MENISYHLQDLVTKEYEEALIHLRYATRILDLAIRLECYPYKFDCSDEIKIIEERLSRGSIDQPDMDHIDEHIQKEILTQTEQEDVEIIRKLLAKCKSE
jgi:hypothetical protein